MVLAAALLSVPGLGDAAREQAAASAVRRLNTQLAQTEARRLEHRVERMVQIRRLLEEATGQAAAAGEADSADTSAAALAARAEKLAAAIEAAERKRRAAALAKMSGMPLAQALREVEARAGADRANTPPAATPAAAIEQLEKRAQEALRAQRAQVAARRDGVKVAYEGTGQVRPADGIPRSLAVQLAAEFRNGPPQGRVGEAGFEGGRSVNPKWIEGVEGGVDARADDPRRQGRLLDGLLAAPVQVLGDSLDLTRATGDGTGDGTGEKARPARIDVAQVRTAAGRVFGPGGAFANRVYLDSWYVIGPFAPGDLADPLDAVHPPEEGIDLDASYRGRDGRILNWAYASRGFYPFIPPEREERAVYYAYTELRIDEGRDLWLTLAADDDSMLWLDDRLVWRSERGPKPWYRPPYYLPDEQVASLALAEGHRRVHLRPGVHRLLLKLYNDRDRAFFSVVIAP